MMEPVKISFDVACSVDHAFDVWTRQIGAWWPADHTVTGEADLVVLQGGVGGRIYERTADGNEHDWGRITVWEPPQQLTYLWHLGADPASATEVEILFHALGEAATRIEIEHRGWERLGRAGDEWRDRNQAGWASLLPHFNRAVEKGG
jgi:uncharacterized protein YndB with AHSA1/START domain